MNWRLSSSFDPVALSIVDGTGRHAKHGPHYSRRTPGSKSFTGCGAEVVLVTEDENAVWAVVYQKTPASRGSGGSRGRTGQAAPTRWIWRNMMFRRLGGPPASELIIEATKRTYEEWEKKYGALPTERLRTEIGLGKVKSSNPGYCYKVCGWTKDRIVKRKLYLWAPERTEALSIARSARR